ncbi:mycoredoxin [Nakamurella flavida]|uniref:Mycoredoxin n=1 Tax=Nakamurella flavida TaxID=363630 RepID=A0A939C5V8_9ACTN|nr:mycoredoxin [Nakamurella flavida]
MTTSTPQSAAPTVYLTSWCPFCARLVHGLDAAGIAFTPVDVDEDEQAGEFVKSLNNGNRIVPTVVFADGSSLTNPPVAQVAARLAS